MNAELVHEFKDTGYAQSWFEKLWSQLDEDSTTEIENYIHNWKRPPRTVFPVTGNSNFDHPSVLISDGHPVDWQGYLTALMECDMHWRATEAKFSVLAEEWSYVDTISKARLLFSRDSWQDLTVEEINLLFGRSSNQGAWGLLGSMRGAGSAVGQFLRNEEIREKIRTLLLPVVSALGEEIFINASTNFIEQMNAMSGFGPAIATRFIALSRPEMGLSVNKGSSPKLGHLTGLPRTSTSLSSTENYERLLRWLYRQPWYQVDEPTDSFERTVWNMRGALIDSFVYSPV